jgi:hypothetical protein
MVQGRFVPFEILTRAFGPPTKPAVSNPGTTRQCSLSALYVNVNPRHVPEALKHTHSHHYKWLEHKAGATHERVRNGESPHFSGTLNRVFDLQISRYKSRGTFAAIDVDNCNPDTWLRRITDAIGMEAMEMVIHTKNGFHVVYRPRKMGREAPLALGEVIKSDTAGGKDSNCDKMPGCAISCVLPDTYQADHKVTMRYCACRGEGVSTRHKS